MQVPRTGESSTNSSLAPAAVTVAAYKNNDLADVCPVTVDI